jgi:hypothetical protein
MADAKTVLQSIGELGQRVKDLDTRLALRRDDKPVRNLEVVADRLSRAQDRATAREYEQFRRDETIAADNRREQARADSIRCGEHQRRYDPIGKQSIG